MMKKMKLYTALTLGLSLIGVSCSESFLENAPPGAYAQEQLLNKKGMEGLLIAAYSALDGSYFESWDRNFFNQDGGGSNWIWGSIRGGEAYKGTEDNDGVDLTPVERYANTEGNPYVLRKWQAGYDGVSKANAVLKNLPNATGLTEEDIARLEGEAKFLRAYYYFELVKVFGAPAYLDETVTDFYTVDNFESVWPKIEADFERAYEILPEIQTAQGRANKWAAAAFLGKVYLFQAKWQEARDILNDVYNSGTNAKGTPYALNANYHHNFRITQEGDNAEFVFTYEASFGDGSIANGNYENTLNNPHGSSTKTGCCGFFQPSQYLVNAFKTDANGLPMFDTFNAVDLKNDDGLESSDAFTPDVTTAVDPRLDWTVGRRGVQYLDWGIHPGKNYIRKQIYGGPYSPKKAVAYLSDFSAGLAGSVDWGFILTAMNVKLMRFSDVVLMLAEAEAELGNTGAALTLVNEVRNRAKNSPVQDATNANYSIEPYDAFGSAAEALEAIRFERMLELAMEGHRYFDLVRWHRASAAGDTQLNFDIVGYMNTYLDSEESKRYHLDGASYTIKYLYEPIPEQVVTQATVNGVRTIDQTTAWGGDASIAY